MHEAAQASACRRLPLFLAGGRRAALALFGLPLATLVAPAGGVQSAPRSGDGGVTAGVRDFESRIAPILIRHCVGCHNPDARQGKLDLTTRASAIAGGAHGRALVPGRSTESLLWKQVEAGRMPPPDGPRPSDEEKRLLRRWIDAGVPWGGSPLDAGGRSDQSEATGRWVQRLTRLEYVETVRAALGVDIEEEAMRLLPPDVRADGFANTAYNQTVDLAHVEAYARLAAIIVHRFDAARFARPYAGGEDLSPAGQRRLIDRMGSWVLRGPLDEREAGSFLRISSAVVEEKGDFAEVARRLLEAMLQSPRFLYRVEAQAGDGKVRRPRDHELASRLSYVLWGAPPDRELMRAADAGELAHRDRCAAQVQRMLQDPRAVRRSLRFVEEWLDLDRLQHLRPDPRRFPAWDVALAADLRAETLAYFEEVAWKQRRPLSALLNTPLTFATPRVAAHYGLPLELASRSRRPGLQALYTFEEGTGSLVRDRSGAGEPVDLAIRDGSDVRWETGGLRLTGPSTLVTARSPGRLVGAIRRSGAVSIEAWITPQDDRRRGPARIVSLSAGPSHRNFTLGQENDRFDVRFRTTRSDPQGLPSLEGPPESIFPRLTHVVYTHDREGRESIYQDGEPRATRVAGKDLSNWDAAYPLALGNEITGDRPWLGTFHVVALFDRALTAGEIRAAARKVTRFDLSGVPGRGGLLTQGSLLTIGGDEASMVERGLFILRELLSGEVGNAPPGVDTTPVPPRRGVSRRAVAEARLANPACGGCHGRFEPFAFGLEKFDGTGARREIDEHGNALREDGTLLFPGGKERVPYRTTGQLFDLLARSESVQRSLTRKVVQFALGRPLGRADAAAFDRICRESAREGGSYASVIRALLMSDLVQTTRTEGSR